MRFLIVEDEMTSADFLSAAVRMAGHEGVGVAADSKTALRLAEAARPHFALVDVGLIDGPTGCDVAVTLRERYGVHPIFVTGRPEIVTPQAREICLAILTKPVTLDDLLSKLTTIVDATKEMGLCD